MSTTDRSERRHHADPTANAAMGAVGDNTTAEQLRARARRREAADRARNAALAALASKRGGADA